MDKDTVITKTREYVHLQLSGEGSGHDWWHIYRVVKLALHIAKKENADQFIVELAALLHDIGDFKFFDGDETVAPRMVRQWVTDLSVPEDTVAHVCAIVRDISFKGAGTIQTRRMETLEGQVVQDADRLDAIGAVGIARTFAYGGFKKREIYNPDIPAEWHENFAAYKKSTGPTINHFYEKLLLLKDLMNTETAKKLAEERHRFMEQYLVQFFKEWNFS